jgi:azurin
VLVVVVTALTGLLLQEAPPKILLDQPLRAVEYQLNRLTNEQLILVERKDDDLKYRPVYSALLTRNGLARQFRDESLAALAKMDKASASQVLLEALGKAPGDDALAARNLLGLLFGQPADALKAERGSFVQAIDGADGALVLQAAYGAWMIADGSPAAAWAAAQKHEGHLLELLRSVPYLPAAGAGLDSLRGGLVTPVSGLVETPATDAAVRVEALNALGWLRRDAATFRLLAREVVKGSRDDARAAAVRSLQLIPESAWPKDEVEPLARAIVAWIDGVGADRRIEPDFVEAIQLGDKLAAALAAGPSREIRRSLRALGVQVIRIETLPEKLSFDLKWFVVEAGKPVQIVLVNPDAMPHNLIVSRPGSLQEVGTAGGAMPVSADPSVKPFVPNLPSVMFSTRLLQGGETERLGFAAPTSPGEYIYVCTFPGHWVRMYGVMLVVENLEAWEARPTVPTDPMTGKPFPSQR